MTFTGFTDLDRLTGGFREGSLVVLASHPYMGQTSLALNIAAHELRREPEPVYGEDLGMREMRQAVAFFSLQHPTEQIVQRMISIVGRFPVHDLREGVHTEDWPRLVRSVAEVSRAPLFVSDSASTTPAAMRSTLEDLSGDLRGTDMRLGMVVVDHLGLMLPPVGSVPNREERVSDVLRELKVLARNLDIPVLLLVQLPRLRGQRHDKRPLLSDFEPTEPVEDFADMVMFLYRDELYNPDSDDKGIAEVIVAKHRSGPTGKVLLAYLESFGKFASLARR